MGSMFWKKKQKKEDSLDANRPISREHYIDNRNRVLKEEGWTVIDGVMNVPLSIEPGLYLYFCAGDNRCIYELYDDFPIGVSLTYPFVECCHKDGWLTVQGIALKIVQPYIELGDNPGWVKVSHFLYANEYITKETSQDTIQIVAYKTPQGKIEYILNWYYTDDLLGEFKNEEDNHSTGIKQEYDGCEVIAYYEVKDVEYMIDKRQ